MRACLPASCLPASLLQGKKGKKGGGEGAAAGPRFKRWKNEELTALMTCLSQLGADRTTDVRREVSVQGVE